MNFKLERNLATWDRWARFGAFLVLVFGMPAVLHGPWWISFVGAFGGAQLLAAITGF
jgi:hypothetical protein